MADKEELRAIDSQEWDQIKGNAISDQPDEGAERVAMDALRNIARQIAKIYGKVDASTVLTYSYSKNLGLTLDDVQQIIDASNHEE